MDVILAENCEQVQAWGPANLLTFGRGCRYTLQSAPCKSVIELSCIQAALQIRMCANRYSQSSSPNHMGLASIVLHSAALWLANQLGAHP